MRREAVCAVGAVVLAWSLLHAQDPQPSQPEFRAAVSLVEVATIVLDESGRPIGDLSATDFEVFENGEPRPLASVRRLVTSGAAADRSRGLRDTSVDTLATNVGVADAPAFVLVLDDLNTSPYDAHRVIRAGLGVLEALPRDALVAVVTTSAEGGSLLTLAPPGVEHVERVKAFRGRVLLTGPQAPEFARRQVRGQAQIGSSVDAPCGQVAFDRNQSQDCGDPTRAARRAQTIEAVGNLLGRAGSRRKVVFWVTEDMGVSPLDPQGNQAAQRAALQGVLNADVAVYPVNPREGHADTRTQAELQEGDRGDNRPDRRTGGLVRFGPGDGALGTQGGQTLEFNTDDLVAVTLDQIARESGGRWITNANDLEVVLAGVVAQNSTSYLIAFESAYAQTPGRHRIQVHVRRSGVQVFARRGYVVPEPQAARGTLPASVPARPADSSVLLRELVGGTVSQGQLAMHVQAVPEFAEGRQGRALVTIRLDPASADHSPVDVLVLAVDDSGRMGNPQGFRLTPPDDGAPDGWTFTTHVALARGGHQVRVAAATADGTRSGLVITPVKIVEPGNRLSMAPVVLLGGTGEDDIEPTLARAFQIGASVGVQAEIAGPPVRDKRATVKASIRDAGGQVHREVEAILHAGSRVDRMRATSALSTADLPEGEYMLVMEALDGSAGSPVRRAVPLTLRTTPAAAGAGAAGAVRSAADDRSTVASGTGAGHVAPPIARPPVALRPLPVAHGPSTSYTRTGPQVIRDATAWTAFWLHLPTQQPPPDIDFDRVTLLAFVLDDTSTPVQPVIARIEMDDTAAVVYWQAVPVAPSSGTVSTPQRPFAVMGVVGHEGPVRFKRVD